MSFEGAGKSNILGVVALLLVCGGAVFLLFPVALKATEWIVYSIFPSQERAMRYGDRHFNAISPRMYDFELAANFFNEANSFDASHPNLSHQLARVAFLRGDNRLALFYINKQIRDHGALLPNSFYMRGLIKGYAGLYDSAAEDYEVFLEHSPDNWAGITDYAWVLLKAGRFAEAAGATERGLSIFPDNAWLLNTSAIALYELGEYEKALERAQKAVDAADRVTEEMWLTAYPGNDPRIAEEGVATLRKSARDNMHKIEAKVGSSTVQ